MYQNIVPYFWHFIGYYFSELESYLTTLSNNNIKKKVSLFLKTRQTYISALNRLILKWYHSGQISKSLHKTSSE